MSILEILGIGLVLFSFIKNIDNWKKNLLYTIVFCFSAYRFLNKISKYKDLHSFSKGTPLCTIQPFIENGFCIYYDAVFTYFIGQILWGYHAIPACGTVLLGKRDTIYYAIHSIPIFGLVTGHFNNWDLDLQLKTDLGLLIICVLNGDFEYTWFGFWEVNRFEEFDRSNFHVYEEQTNICEESGEESGEESCDESSDESGEEKEEDDREESLKEHILRKHYNTRSRKRSLKTNTSY
tara:strand:+ start:82 stop:789 length:708 start_codon:yes stop_codon:yes gene_type:complete